MPARIKGIIFALISSGTFGLIPLFSLPLLKGAHMNEFSILFYRYLFSAFAIGILCLIQKKSLKINNKQLITLFILSLFSAATAMGLIHSYRYITSGIATTIHFLYPILVTLLMTLFFKEKKSVLLFLAAGISLTGVCFLCWTDNGFINTKGLLIALSTVFTYSSYIVTLNKSEASKLDSKVVTFYIILFNMLFFFIISVSTRGIDKIPIKYFLNVLLLALLPTVVSNIALVIAVKNAGSTITSILGSMEPLVAVIVGAFYFSESFGWHSLVGLFLIIISVIMVIIGANRNSKKKKIRYAVDIKPFHQAHH